MKLETALKQIRKESEFLGISAQAVINDVARYGRRIYSERTVEAYHVIVANLPQYDEYSPFSTVNS